MPVEKIAASLPPQVVAEIRTDLAEHGEASLSAWLLDAARLKLRRRRLEHVVQEFERAHGRITEEELAEVRTGWPAA